MGNPFLMISDDTNFDFEKIAVSLHDRVNTLNSTLNVALNYLSVLKNGEK